jgi:hypothetical protein
MPMYHMKIISEYLDHLRSTLVNFALEAPVSIYCLSHVIIQPVKCHKTPHTTRTEQLDAMIQYVPLSAIAMQMADIKTN